MVRSLFLLAAVTLACAQQQPAFPSKEADFIAKDFTFHTGEKMAELRLHYTTLGEPRRDAAGHVRNAVIVMHGTGGTGRAFLSAGVRRRAIRQRPAARHQRATSSSCPTPSATAESSKPTDGLHMKFPHYDLRGHGARRLPAGHRGPRRRSPAAGDGHVDGRDAHLDLGRNSIPTSWTR